MEIIFLWFLVAAIIMVPMVRRTIGKGCLLFIVGFLILVGVYLLLYIFYYS